MSDTTSRPPEEEKKDGLRWNAWNLLLIVPLFMLVTPWFNTKEPTLIGMPFFYWIQFVWVAVGVICVAIVYVKTRDEIDPIAPGEPGDVDELDEGTLR
jgi:hypothetical protein